MLEIPSNFIDRAFKSWLPKAWLGKKSEGRGISNQQKSLALSLTPSLPDEELQALRDWINTCLADEGCQATTRARSAILGSNFLQLNKQGRLKFMRLLAMEYGVDEQEIQAAIANWQTLSSQGDLLQKALAEHHLREALTPARFKLLKHFSSLPSGVKFLVDMRAEALSLLKKHPELKPLDIDLKSLFTSWFDIGLLQLEQIGWQSSAEVLEKLIAYEAVHTIQSWSDLKNRLDSDRRCFAFFHPNMPHEPLIFVEVALVNGIANNVQALLDETAPVENINQADTAIFYSISNAQRGLAGISFGNYLIKQVVGQLQGEFAQLKNFATLSPVPGFVSWLKQLDKDKLIALSGGADWVIGIESDLTEKNLSRLPEKEQKSLQQLMLHYLSKEKGANAVAKDSVAHFHLSNGSQLHEINWLADTSKKGMAQSAGMMVNYLYELPKIANRSLQYARSGSTAVSTKLQERLK